MSIHVRDARVRIRTDHSPHHPAHVAWHAVLIGKNGTYQLTGYGPTESEAIHDLLNQMGDGDDHAG